MTVRVNRVVAVTSITCCLLVQYPRPASGQEATIEGTWLVLVTLTNCSNGAPLPLPPFYSLVSFLAGGRIVESTGSVGFQPNQRSEGHGNWSRLGPQTYSQRVVALIRYGNSPQTVPPLNAGAQTITQTVTLVNPNAFTSTGTTDFYGLDSQQYRTGCSAAVGMRFN